MAADIIAFIRALGSEQVDIFGFSIGGMVAQQVALDAPDLVRRLLLVGTGPAGGEGMAEFTPQVNEIISRPNTTVWPTAAGAVLLTDRHEPGRWQGLAFAHRGAADGSRAALDRPRLSRAAGCDDEMGASDSERALRAP